MKSFKIYWIFILLLSSTFTYGQVDYGEIKQKISDEGSDTFYSKLLQRFIDSDSTLTREDFHLLYFGAVLHKNYNPDQIMVSEGQIRLANYAGEFLEAYNLADSLLKEYPMSAQAYFEKAYACFNLKRFDEEAYNNKRYKVLIKTILASGDGKSFETAYHANTPNDEFETLKFLQLSSKEEAEVEFDNNNFDVFTLKSNKLKLKQIYFNVTRQNRDR